MRRVFRQVPAVEGKIEDRDIADIESSMVRLDLAPGNELDAFGADFDQRLRNVIAGDEGIGSDVSFVGEVGAETSAFGKHRRLASAKLLGLNGTVCFVNDMFAGPKLL